MQFPRLFSLLLLAAFAPLLTFGQVQQTPDDLIAEGKQRYGIEKGQVKYEFRGQASGSELVQFDRFGWLESRVTEKETRTFGMTSNQKYHSILKGNRQAYHVTGSQYVNVSNERFLTSALSESSPSMQVLFGEEVIKRKNAKQVGSEEILGRRCKVYDVKYENTKVWVWEGIILKSVQTIHTDKITMEAIQIDEDWEAGPSTFQLPENLNVNGMEWE